MTHANVHPIPPVYDSQSEILILGSFPSVKSREQGFFYGHPQNRFWRLLAAVYGEEPPQTTHDKRALLLRRHIAVWDVIASCEIVGSSDASIRNAVPTDLSPIFASAPIRKILCNGATSYNLFQKYQASTAPLPAIKMPSTSPANAACSFEKLLCVWENELKK